MGSVIRWNLSVIKWDLSVVNEIKRMNLWFRSAFSALKNRPCRICSKPTYCGFSTDEGTSICMRISAGFPATVEIWTFIAKFHSSRFKQESRDSLANHFRWLLLEIRDAVFQELMRISPASNYMEELVTGPRGLLSWRLIEDDATRYGALPRTKQVQFEVWFRRTDHTLPKNQNLHPTTLCQNTAN